jgi:hypothetical protein
MAKPPGDKFWTTERLMAVAFMLGQRSPAKEIADLIDPKVSAYDIKRLAEHYGISLPEYSDDYEPEVSFTLHPVVHNNLFFSAYKRNISASEMARMIMIRILISVGKNKPLIDEWFPIKERGFRGIRKIPHGQPGSVKTGNYIGHPKKRSGENKT